MAEYTTQGPLRGTRPPPGKASVAAGGPQSASSPGAAGVSPQLREMMIREAAYFRAEHRSFAPGADLEDWFSAEREIDAVLAQRAPGVQPSAAPIRPHRG